MAREEGGSLIQRLIKHGPQVVAGARQDDGPASAQAAGEADELLRGRPGVLGPVDHQGGAAHLAPVCRPPLPLVTKRKAEGEKGTAARSGGGVAGDAAPERDPGGDRVRVERAFEDGLRPVEGAERELQACRFEAAPAKTLDVAPDGLRRAPPAGRDQDPQRRSRNPRRSRFSSSGWTARSRKRPRP